MSNKLVRDLAIGDIILIGKRKKKPYTIVDIIMPDINRIPEEYRSKYIIVLHTCGQLVLEPEDELEIIDYEERHRNLKKLEKYDRIIDIGYCFSNYFSDLMITLDLNLKNKYCLLSDHFYYKTRRIEIIKEKFRISLNNNY